ncbi:MAG: type II/IV secretion system protein [Arenimonas sp.]|nr:type II/IV secretion system protein [Arenimonas sp.]
MHALNDAAQKVIILNDSNEIFEYSKYLSSGQFIWSHFSHQIDLTQWLKLSDDYTQREFETSSTLGIPIIRLSKFELQQSAIALLSANTARKYRAVPIFLAGDSCIIAMERPNDKTALEALSFVCKPKVFPVLANGKEICDAIAKYYDRVEDWELLNQIGINTESITIDTTEEEALRFSNKKPIVREVSNILGDAASRRASDIHFRPGPDGTDVLFRIDGELIPVRRLVSNLHRAIISRVKVLGQMNLAEHRKAQDGRSNFILENGRTIDLRISVLPTVYGESVVIRLLDTMESLWNIEQIGLEPVDRQKLNDVMARSHGMFLTTGPTGCGKSTTLYAMLMEMRKKHVNILTIEDPVEFHIADVQQMQVNRAASFTFASALRNFLRHDPDIIMVGEIRDRETASIAVESALTGHLLLSTLHTNTAATTITRLLDLGVESYLLRASLLAVMAQRLVRLTCNHCKEREQIDDRILQYYGLSKDEEFFIGRGCSHCDGLGIKHRKAIYELMVVSKGIQELIVKGAEADKIHQLAVSEGMRPLTQAAIDLARKGEISLQEAWRVRSE